MAEDVAKPIKVYLSKEQRQIIRSLAREHSLSMENFILQCVFLQIVQYIKLHDENLGLSGIKQIFIEKWVKQQ